MKAGLLTFHKAINIGAALQAYALDEFINRNFFSCEIIDFLPNSECSRFPQFLYTFLYKIKTYITDKNLYYREKKFEMFRRKMHISKRRFYGDRQMSHSELEKVYDMLISGSDQIFNMLLSGKTESYYLGFWKGKKISYASSFGRENVSELEVEMIRKRLPDFFALSMREQSGVDLVYEHIGKRPELVLDPVFLLDEIEWLQLSSRLSKKNGYIFAYLMEVDDEIVSTLNEISAQKGLPLIYVYGGGGTCKGIVGERDDICGPIDFINYIANADYVVTNSFHGTAFSIIMKKKFICLKHSSRNTRLQNIMGLAGLEGMVFDVHAHQESVEYDNYFAKGTECERLLPHIERSKQYLAMACGQ